MTALSIYVVSFEIEHFYNRECRILKRYGPHPPLNLLVQLIPPIPKHIFKTASDVSTALIWYDRGVDPDMIYDNWENFYKLYIMSDALDLNDLHNFRECIKKMGGCLFYQNEQKALLKMVSQLSITHKIGPILKSAMDGTDLIQASPYGPVWAIERNGPASPIDFDKRRKALLLSMVKEFEYVYLASDRPVNVPGTLDMPNGRYRIADNIKLDDLYEWMKGGKWALYGTSKPGITYEMALNGTVMDDPELTSLRQNNVLCVLRNEENNTRWLLAVDSEEGMKYWKSRQQKKK